MMTINKPSKWAKAKISATFFLVAGVVVLLTCNFVVLNNDKVELFYKNGNKKFEAETKDGKINGAFTCWDSLNHVTFTGSFDEKGLVDGIESAYKNGIKQAEYYYQKDTLRNFMSSWFENGQLAEKVIKDESKGPQKLIRYFESGAKYEEIEYSYSVKGKAKFILWNENGEIVFSGFFNENILFSDNSTQPFSGKINVFFKNGKEARECNFKDGQPIGIESEWYNNGNKRAEINHISVTKYNTNSWEVRTDIKNWDLSGTLTSAGNLTYGGMQFFMPFSIERESFLTYSIYSHSHGGMITSLKKELENLKKI